MVITWLVITLSALTNGTWAALCYFALVVLAGLCAGFLSVRKRFRPHASIPAFAWGATWFGVYFASVSARFIRKVGEVPVGTLADWSRPSSGARDVAVLIHGTWGGSKYDWGRWQRIADGLEQQGWRVMRFAWSGGNATAARTIAARRLAEQVDDLRRNGVDGRTLLVGHSHGGTIALETATICSVTGVVALATPFIRLGNKLQGYIGTDIGIGMWTRLFGPIFFIMAAIFFVTRPMSGGQGLLLSVGSGVLLMLGLGSVFVKLLMLADAEGKVLISQKARDPIGKPILLGVASSHDWVIAQLRHIDSVVADASEIIDGECSLVRAALEKRLIGPEPNSFFLQMLRSPVLREISQMAIFSFAVLLLVAVLGRTGVFPQVTSGALSKWFYPTVNELGAKFFVYAVTLGLLYSGWLRISQNNWLPKAFQVTLQGAKYCAMAARLSQAYSFKAGLLGMSAFCLHTIDNQVSTESTVPNMKAHLATEEAADGHSNILRASAWIRDLPSLFEQNQSSASFCIAPSDPEEQCTIAMAAASPPV